MSVRLSQREDGNWTLSIDNAIVIGTAQRFAALPVEVAVENGELQELLELLKREFPETHCEDAKSDVVDHEYREFARYVAEVGPPKPVLEALVAGYKLGAMAVREGRY